MNYKNLRNRAKKLCNDSNFSASSGWVLNFRKRHNVTKRVPTHIILLANSIESMNIYLAEIRAYGNELEILKKFQDKKYVIFCNLDETAVQLNMQDMNTYDIIGSSEILVQKSLI